MHVYSLDQDFKDLTPGPAVSEVVDAEPPFRRRTS
jgi:hypothetical protein